MNDNTNIEYTYFFFLVTLSLSVAHKTLCRRRHSSIQKAEHSNCATNNGIDTKVNDT